MTLKKLFFALFLSTLLLGACTEEMNTQVIETGEIQGIVSTTKQTAEKHDVSKFEEFELQEVIDGDTIRIKYNGSSEKVRFLLVDTPETNHETLGEQPYGPEAKAFMKELLAGQKTVYLEFDVSYRDKYKRLLAYIYTKDGISLQEELLKNGLARVAYIYAPNTKHVNWFKDIQKTAQKSAVGIWSVEDYVTNRGYDKEVYYEAEKAGKPVSSNEAPVTEKPAEANEVAQENDACVIKGNINSKGNKIYHMPGQQNYDDTDPEEMFCTPEEAETAGFRAAQR
ncbi:MAG: thermonuclease family protein [Solibacillus sp.]